MKMKGNFEMFVISLGLWFVSAIFCGIVIFV